MQLLKGCSSLVKPWVRSPCALPGLRLQFLCDYLPNNLLQPFKHPVIACHILSVLIFSNSKRHLSAGHALSKCQAFTGHSFLFRRIHFVNCVAVSSLSRLCGGLNPGYNCTSVYPGAIKSLFQAPLIELCPFSTDVWSGLMI